MSDASRPRRQSTTTTTVYETLECADDASLKLLLADISREGGRVVSVIKNRQSKSYSVVVDRGRRQ